jgi:hypothetical protein
VGERGAEVDGGADGVVADVVVGVVEEGSSLLSVPQAAVNAPIAMIPATPATAARLRTGGRDFIIRS